MRILATFLVWLILTTISPPTTQAADFDVEALADYFLTETGETRVVHELSIINKSTDAYPSSFSFKTTGLATDDIKVYDETGSLDYELDSIPGSKTFTINNPRAAVGINEETRVWFEFVNKSFIDITGDVKEVTLPKVVDTGGFDGYTLRINVPSEFKEIAYMSPNSDRKVETTENDIYYFNKDTLYETITIGLGESQVFSFDLTYHLENPLHRTSKAFISIPPDTAKQEVLYQEIVPSPDDITVDSDGNWIAEYNLIPRERLDVRAIGYVTLQTAYDPKLPVSKASLDANLAQTEFWQSENSTIKALAKELATPEEIYDYVVDSLEYNYDKVSPTSERLGAIRALKQPNFAICTEFTDLFVALSRAAGIPAREINGFAYTENQTLKPLSLVADVLHAWPEYWDSAKAQWVAVDPTWEDTTGGIDYFNKLDLRHITFVTHGVSSTEPFSAGSYKLGPNPQKDIYVSLAQLPDLNSTKLKLERVGAGKVKIFNPGPRALYNIPYKIQFDDKLVVEDSIQYILPFQTTEISLDTGGKPFAIDAPATIKLSMDGQVLEYKIAKSRVLLRDLLILIVGVTTIVTPIALIIFKWKK